MALYTNESKERVRDAVDFIELVSAQTELRRAGASSYQGVCPFHDDRSPSFGIDPVQKVYYCFGCQAAGDVFSFVQETEGVDFKGALELLAERYGVELQREQEDPREAERRKQRERLLELLKRTTGYYERYLWESSEAARAREYLAERGLREETLREFRVGYAPSAWDRVLLASRRGGFTEAELYATGLAQRSKQNGQPYDRFRGRIMFPLADVRGHVLGFGARAMRDDQKPKYLNTSDNDVYHKGNYVFGADLARIDSTRAGEVIVCEGYTDVIALRQAGIRNVVGLMGTALTEKQVGELGRLANSALLALDADSAGQDAMLRAFSVAEDRKLKLRVVPIPVGLDPAELVQRDGAEQVKAMIEQSIPFVRFRVDRALAKGDLRSAEGRERVAQEVAPVFAQLQPGTTQMELITLISEQLDLPKSLAERLLQEAADLNRASRQTQSTTGANGAQAAVPQAISRRDFTRGEDAERAFLALCLAAPDEGAPMLADVDVDQDFSSELLRRAARHLREVDLRQPMAAVPGEQPTLDDDPELKRLLAELVVEAGRDDANPAMLEAQRLQLELARIDRQIQQARGRQSGEVSELAQRKAIIKLDFDRAYSRVLEQTGEGE